MAGAVAAATTMIAVAAVVNFMAKLICGRYVEAVRQSATFATGFLNSQPTHSFWRAQIVFLSFRVSETDPCVASAV